MTLQTNKYQQILNGLKEKIRQARFKAALTANAHLLAIYWEVGKTILEHQKQQGWGAKIIDNLSQDLKLEFPDFKGLSVRNLKYMRAFAEAYPDFLFVQPPAAQIKRGRKPASPIVQGALAQIETKATNSIVQVPLAQLDSRQILQAPLAKITWYHHITLLDKVKSPEERLF